MTSPIYQAEHNQKRYQIEEDSPVVGWYLFVYDQKGRCIADYLQGSAEVCKAFALEEFGVPSDAWQIIS